MNLVQSETLMVFLSCVALIVYFVYDYVISVEPVSMLANMHYFWHAALNLTSKMKNKMEKQECESFLATVKVDGWLCDVQLGGAGTKLICLGPRSALELQPFLQDEATPRCRLCSEVCILGQTCLNEHCQVPQKAPGTRVKMHLHCLRAREPKNPNDKQKCVVCKVEWAQVLSPAPVSSPKPLPFRAGDPSCVK